jgi:succinate dehydrogenase/fumarate reductase cytochrome b subunit
MLWYHSGEGHRKAEKPISTAQITVFSTQNTRSTKGVIPGVFLAFTILFLASALAGKVATFPQFVATSIQLLYNFYTTSFNLGFG